MPNVYERQYTVSIQTQGYVLGIPEDVVTNKTSGRITCGSTSTFATGALSRTETSQT